MNPTPLADLDQFDHGYPIQCVTGNLCTLYPSKEGVGKTGKPYFMQDGELEDENGLKHKVLFNDKESAAKVDGKRGKTITISSQMVKGRPSGLSMDVNQWNGKTTRRLRVTSAALITVTGGGSQPSNATEGPQGGKEPPSGEHVCFDAALADYRKAFDKTCEAFGFSATTILAASKSGDAGALTLMGHMKEITTSVSMASTRGQYGRYIGYKFAGPKVESGLNPDGSIAEEGEEEIPF